MSSPTRPAHVPLRMGASPNRARRRWDTTSPPPPLVVLTEEDDTQAAPPPSATAAATAATLVPPLGLGRMRSFEAPSSSLSAREARDAPVPLPGPLTARPLGVTPRNAAMLGPRSEAALRGMDALGLPISRPATYVGPAAQLHSPRHLNSPRSALSPRGAPGGRGAADAAARRGENHPRLRSPRAAPPESGSEWALAAADSLAEAGGDAAGTAAAADWLPHALGCRVDVVDVGLAAEAGAALSCEELCGATLLGPVVGIGAGGGVADGWSVAPAHGAPPTVVPTLMLRRVVPAKGERARVVRGSAANLGFHGEVLSVERSVAVVRGMGGAAGGGGGGGGAGSAEPETRVRVLPLDALCAIK